MNSLAFNGNHFLVIINTEELLEHTGVELANVVISFHFFDHIPDSILIITAIDYSGMCQ